MSYIFTFSKDTLTVLLNKKPETVYDTHPQWARIIGIIKGEIQGTEEELKGLIDTREAVKKIVESANIGRVNVGYDGITLDGKAIHSHLTTRMMEMLKLGINVAPWAAFMEKLYQNPSNTAVNELYLWLEKSGMPLTPTGNFLAYKKVNSDYTSYHKNPDGSKCNNQIGTVVEMPRNEVDDDRNKTCSAGLHFCSWHYLSSYYGSSGRVVLVEINPADVVSIPSDYDNAKGRAWRYVVVGEVDQKDTSHLFAGQYVADTLSFDDNVDDTEDHKGMTYYTSMDLFVDADGLVDLSTLDLKNGSWGKIKGTKNKLNFGNYSRDYQHFGTYYTLRVWFGPNKNVMKAKLL